MSPAVGDDQIVKYSALGVAAMNTLTSAEATYKGYVLDPFQRQALEYIEAGQSVIVSAPTGVGKTLIADYLIEKAVRENRRVIYTAPLKALSNQKYRQFKASLGEELVGIITGDVVHNSEAPVVMMTTEIYRNMVLTEPERAADIHYLIFDEIHYIDSDRGVAWEESLIFAPSHVKFLGLSATIGNLEQFIGWLSEVRKEQVALVVETKRVVPLAHRYFNLGTGIVRLPEMSTAVKDDKLRPTDHRDLVRVLRSHYLPALMFGFSRRQCIEKAMDTMKERSFLTREEHQAVQRALDAYQNLYRLESNASFQLLARMLSKGVGYHHAGLLPVLKDLVEELFEHKLVKVLYCTETFSVGVNYPVQSVCFLEQRKYDGKTTRPLSTQEYMQMAGRAGRRGIDEQGYVFTLVSGRGPILLDDYANRAVEDIGSQFRLSCNSILNLLRRDEPEQVVTAFNSSFAHYLNEAQRSSLLADLAVMQANQQKVAGAACVDRTELLCPINYRRTKSRLGGMERDARRGKHFLRKRCAELRQQLSQVTPRDCTRQTMDACRRGHRDAVVMQELVVTMEARLQTLPTEADWLARFRLIKQRLEQLGYLDDDQILPRGELGSEINFQEILITEFVFAGMMDELSIPELCGLLCGVDFEGRFSDFTQRGRLPALRKYWRIADELKSDRVLGPDIIYSPQVAPIGYLWATGASLPELLEITTIEEGDVVSLLRRTVDVLRQLRKALGHEPFWGDKLRECMKLMERDMVKVDL